MTLEKREAPLEELDVRSMLLYIHKSVFIGKWIELENVILSEVTQTQKDKHAPSDAIRANTQRGAFQIISRLTSLKDMAQEEQLQVIQQEVKMDLQLRPLLVGKGKEIDDQVQPLICPFVDQVHHHTFPTGNQLPHLTCHCWSEDPSHIISTRSWKLRISCISSFSVYDTLF
ncbi:hypothetical protein STEG23_027154 [Scotinomys teguina]